MKHTLTAEFVPYNDASFAYQSVNKRTRVKKKEALL